MTERVCPRCIRRYTKHPALSRVNNQTPICPDCGVAEAMLGRDIHDKKNMACSGWRYSVQDKEVNPTRYELGGVAWQSAMVHNIRWRVLKGKELTHQQECFLEIQAEHIATQGDAMLNVQLGAVE